MQKAEGKVDIVNTLTAIALSGMIQSAAASDDVGGAARLNASSGVTARVVLQRRGEQRAVAVEQRRVVRELQKNQTQEIRTEVKTETVSGSRQEVYQSIQDAKAIAREQLRKLVDEEKALLRSGG